jgi:integrase
VSESYLNRREFKDGQVILFNRPGSKRPIWHMRIHVRGMRDIVGNKFSHVQLSTGQTDIEEATRVALNKFDDLRMRVSVNAPAVDVTFEDLYALWWAGKRQQLESMHVIKGRSGVTKRIGWYEKFSKRYWLPYFGTKKIGELNQAFVAGYWQWRVGYWAAATADERKRYPNHAINPAKKSLDMEQSALREVFAWANAMRIITYAPVIENPYARRGLATKRRPSFDVKEWTQLQDYLDQWAVGNGVNDKLKGARVNSHHLYQRQLLRIYIHWLEGTGMRTGEVLLLKHKDVRRTRTDAAEMVVLKIKVSPHTKTGARVVTSQPSVAKFYGELRELTGRTDREDWLFCSKDGKPTKGFYKTLPDMLDEIGLLTDEHGDRRVAYSFRHLYAEGRFRAIGINPKAYDLISTNMGTGRQSLENHYVRKGVIDDDDALIDSVGIARRNNVGEGLTEWERRLIAPDHRR